MKYNSILFIIIILLLVILIINTYFINNQMSLKMIESFTNQVSCVNKNIDYGSVCTDTNNSKDYGIASFEVCSTDENKYKLNCGKMIFNGVDYTDEGLYTTGCIDKSLDMDTMCNTYMPDDVKSISKNNGYYNRSAGSKLILNGKDGDCYNNDGSPNKNKSRAICNLSSNRKINRIPPFNKHIKYNKFTDCYNMETYDFKSDCQTILNNKTNSVFAQIDGFDCMPGFARAKCLDKDEFITNHNDFYKFVSEI